MRISRFNMGQESVVFANVREEICQFWRERSLLTMKFLWRFYWILKRKVYLAKMNSLPKHHGAGSQRRGAQCSCIGCIGLRPALAPSVCRRLSCVKCDECFCIQFWFLGFILGLTSFPIGSSLFSICSPAAVLYFCCFKTSYCCRGFTFWYNDTNRMISHFICFCKLSRDFKF